MLDSSVLPLFLTSIFILTIMPGPDMAFILSTGISSGKRSALTALVGIELAMFTHVLLAASGFAALTISMPILIDMIKYVGAVYLLGLAFQAYTNAPIALNQIHPTEQTHKKHFFQGFMTNLLNPKAILFVSVFFPQFISLSHHSTFIQYVILGSILSAFGLTFGSMLAISSGSIGRWIIARKNGQVV